MILSIGENQENKMFTSSVFTKMLIFKKCQKKGNVEA